MMLNRYGMFAVDRLGREMDQLFTTLFDGGRASVWGRGFPALNVWEEGDNLFIEAEVPGLKLEDVEISVAGDELTLQGRRRTEPDQEAAYYRRERSSGEFARVLKLPVEVDAEKVEATLKDGILSIKLPKPDEAKPKRIVVKGE